MKKITLILAVLLFSLKIYAQQNVFPNNGNVGIGTTSPSVKLDVNGQLKVKQNAFFEADVNAINIPSLTSIPYIDSSSNNGNGNNTLNDQEYYQLYIDKNGTIKRGKEVLVNKIINTIQDPCDQMAEPEPGPVPGGGNDETLGGGGNGGGNPNGGGNENSNLGFLNDKTNLDGLSLKSGNTPFADWNRYPNRLCVCNNIFIGIGTCIPRVELDVIGTGYLSKLAIGNINPTNLENRYFYLKTSSQTEANQAIFTIENNDRKIFQIENNGLIWCREIKLNQTWADYVFDNNYKLMPLKELENFIIHNKHLPNIPSAQVIEKEGITVNETNRILLEKIEELTLYVIQQQKEIEELKEKLIK